MLTNNALMNVIDNMTWLGRINTISFCSILGADPATSAGDSYRWSSPGSIRSCQLSHRTWLHYPLLSYGRLLLPKWILRPQDQGGQLVSLITRKEN